MGTPTFPNDLRQSATSVQQPIPPSQVSQQQPRISGHLSQQHPTSGHVSEEAIPAIAESNWSVQAITCLETRTKEFPLYVQLGPAAGHRGNQGMYRGNQGMHIKEETIHKLLLAF